MALVDGTDSGIGYGRAPAPAPGPVWDANIGAYRDPVSGRVAVGSDAAGWRWVTEAEYRAMYMGPFEDQIPMYSLGGEMLADDRAAYNGLAYPYQQVEAPYYPRTVTGGYTGDTGETQPLLQPSATKHTSPAPAPTPAPASLQVIGGQIVRLPR